MNSAGSMQARVHRRVLSEELAYQVLHTPRSAVPAHSKQVLQAVRDAMQGAKVNALHKEAKELHWNCCCEDAAPNGLGTLVS